MSQSMSVECLFSITLIQSEEEEEEVKGQRRWSACSQQPPCLTPSRTKPSPEFGT